MNDRDTKICKAYQDGFSLRSVAAMFRLSHERVRQIVKLTRSSRARALDGAIRSLGTPLNVKG